MGVFELTERSEGTASGPGLLASPFAVPGVTPRTPIAELLEQADGPAAVAAARAVSVPRSRLAAEASFLPGVPDGGAAILAALRAGRRADPTGLPPLAATNLRAHLCTVGLATADDVAGLARDMPVSVDDALVAAIDADRLAAGMPPCQREALAAEIEALTEAHAGALVGACMAGTDPVGHLAGLLQDDPGRPTPILRRAAAAWTRRTAAALATLQAEAGAAASAWQARPEPDTLQALEAALRAWAASSRPQRLADARAALDHPPTMRALAPWRAAIRRVAQSGQAVAALPAARLLAELFDDLPGEAATLQAELRGLAAEVRGLAAAGEAEALAQHLARLDELVARLSADPALLRAGLATRPFGLDARKDAGALWAAFDAAATASLASEAAWDAVVPLAALLDVPNRAGGTRAAAALFAGLVGRAEAQGRNDLAARLRALQRAQQAAAALRLHAHRSRRRRLPWWLSPLRRRGIRVAIERALLVVDDPAERRRLKAERAALRRRGRVAWASAGVGVALAGLGGGAAGLDARYAALAPYRHQPAISLASPALTALPAPPSVPADMPAPAPAAMPVPAEPPAPARAFDFPVRAGERMPDASRRGLTRAELRWCLANHARLEAALDAADPADRPGLDELETRLIRRCDGRSVRRLDEGAVLPDVAAGRDRLRAEGEAMLGAPPR